MKSAARSGASVIIGALALFYGSAPVSTQAIADSGNRYPNVGAIMIWRVDDSGRQVELRAFASGTLIGDRVMLTAGHFTAPVKALGGMPATLRAVASFSATDARDPRTWIPVTAHATHPSMPHCPPPPQCDPTDDDLVAPLEPGIADVGLVFLERAPANVKPAVLAAPDTLARSEGVRTTIVGYGTTSAPDIRTPVASWPWDGKRRIRTSDVRKVIDETWALWSIPSYVCFGDSGGGIFLNNALVANVSDGGRDCRRHNNNHRLDTRAIQTWIDATIKAQGALGALPGAAQQPIAPSGTLRAAFIAGNPAMAVKNPATGELGGPAVDLAREFSRQRGVDVALVGVETPQNVIDAVRTGKADIGFVAYNPERAGAVEFSRPFMLVQQSFLVKQDSPIRSVKEIDRPNLKIGARKADSMALYLARTLQNATLVEIAETNAGEGAQAVAAGELHAFGSNRQRLSDALRAVPGLRLLPDDLYGVEQTIIVPAGNADRLKAVNEFVDEIRRSGFLAASIARSGVIGIAVAGP